MNILGNLTGGQIFIITVFGFMLFLILESIRRELKVRPWYKVAFRLTCLIIGMRIIFYGLREIQSGRWTGLLFVLFGPIITYFGGSREILKEKMKKRAVKDQVRE